MSERSLSRPEKCPDNALVYCIPFRVVGNCGYGETAGNVLESLNGLGQIFTRVVGKTRMAAPDGVGQSWLGCVV